MSSDGKESSTLILTYIGEDFWSQPVYRDQFNHLWKDTELGDSAQPCLYAVISNDIDDDPGMPIQQDFIIQPIGNPISKEKRAQYQMLSRLKSDCDYYLGFGYRNPGRLWAGNEKNQIEEMKALWLSFSETEKPEWMTWEQILDYEKQMCPSS